MADRKEFPGITAEAFTSDADRWALDKLKRVPLLPLVIRKFHELGFDRWFYLVNMGMSVRCGPKQYGGLYAILQESCKILDMPEPELYVTCNPMPNAFAGGIERPYITVRSGMIDTLNDDQLFYLIGHELGHIKAQHVLYFEVYVVLFGLLDILSRGTLGASEIASTALVLAYFEWFRQAEFSADRCGLVVSQSANDCIDSLISFTAGPNRMAGDLSREAYMDQARAYQNADALDQFGKALLFYMNNWKMTHPFPVARVQELDRWFTGGGLQRILDGDYPKIATEGAA